MMSPLKLKDATCTFLAMTIGIIVSLELFSWTCLMVYGGYSKLVKPMLVQKNVHSGSKDPMEATDEQLRLLYSTNQPESYREMLKETWGGALVRKYEPLVEHSERTMIGKWVNVAKDGYRKVEGQFPLDAHKSRPTIFVFGGSTTFGYGVKDSESVPSALQKVLRDQHRLDVAVFNFGSGNYYSTLERIRFEKLLTRGYVPDIAVFIDGLNDANFYKVPDESVFSESIATLMEQSPARTCLIAVANSSNTVELATAIIGKLGLLEAAPSAAAIRDTGSRVAVAVDRLIANQKILRGISTEYGITPVFVIQPTPFFNYDNSRRIGGVAFHNDNLVDSLTEERAYASISEGLRSKRISDENVLWLGDFAIDGNQYVDFVHYTPTFSKAIANEIATFILKQDSVHRWPIIH